MLQFGSSLTYELLKASLLWSLRFGEFREERKRQKERDMLGWSINHKKEGKVQKGVETKMKADASFVTTATSIKEVRIKGDHH